MPTIVIIDDRATNRNILTRLAKVVEPGGRVEAFASPEAALEWVEDNIPDLVVTDFKMGAMNGAEFVRAFRKLPMCYDVPAIVVTIYEDRNFRYEALEAGATDFLLSPIDHNEFQARAKNLLTLRRQQQIIKNRAVSLEQRLMTNEREHKVALRESQETLRRVINAVPAMISACDSKSNYIFMNSFQAEQLGITPAEAVDRTAIDLFGKEYGLRNMELDREVFKTGETVPRIEETYTARDGSSRVLLTTKSPLKDAAGQVTNVVTVSLDITERKAAEEELKEAKDAAVAANRSKTEFLANMSHELRTPLNAIIGFAEIMTTETLGPIGSPRYREYARDIGDSATHLLDIINDILDVSKIEAGKLDVFEEEVGIAEAIDSVVRLVKPRSQEAGIEIAITVANALPTLRIDARHLKQVLLNILSNALKFTEKGGEVGIGASLERGGELCIDVSDSGIGMTDEEIKIATSRFGQVESSMARKFHGTGLGLPLAIGLLELHDGRLDISSSKGKGTTVTIAFPAARLMRRSKNTQ
ncbi:MAG: response regulator [Alphaproteobacteria bacterium]|nr:response regulator [Alphaproteobacteria bacterium]